jgi:Helix-turn-helix domain of resolvase
MASSCSDTGRAVTRLREMHPPRSKMSLIVEHTCPQSGSCPPAEGAVSHTSGSPRARNRHAAVHTLLAEGVGIKAICRQLDLTRGTVRRSARAETVAELLTRTGTGRRPSLLEQFKPYLHERWNAGCTNAEVLFTDIAERGYLGGSTLVRHYLHQFRAATRIPAPPHKPPSVRRRAGSAMATRPASRASSNTMGPSTCGASRCAV